jgi:serine/threonine protein kinase
MPLETEEAVIAGLLKLPAHERAIYLKRAFQDTPALQARLDEIIHAATAGPPPQDRTPLPSSDGERLRALELAFEPEENASETIGPYKLLQKIGEGGFGTVWMAEQTEPVRRRVALKVIKSGMDTREVIARFAAERQALALMDHPNIARVFDAGGTDLGRPYFVMELVRGIPITKYCDENRVSTEERLKLFIAVCNAVQHAHHKGIIHRDLKPSNIIVTLHDGVPMPKIIDFGIAKATERPLTEKTLFTQFHAFIGTPAYTSPEQMELSGLDVDTRSDIYSLGILLYELLTGRPPFDPDELMKAGLEEIRRTIREVDPPRPSHRLRTLSEELLSTVARQRRTDSAKLSLLLRGDLDWIVMHCLEKDRTRRYDTANALAMDVGRYLNDEIVLARPPSSADRLRKLYRRQKLKFIAGALVALSLIAGLIASSVLLLRERAAHVRAVAAETIQARLRQEAERGQAREASLRAEADANAHRAQMAAAKSAQVARFMTEMLNGVAPSVALGRDTQLLRDILDTTARRLDNELAGQPAIAAELRGTLGTVHYDLGQYQTAETLLRDSLALHRSVSPEPNAAVATSLHQLGTVLYRLNKAAEAETTLQEALTIRRKLFGDEDASVADTLHQLSSVPHAQRSMNDRRALLEEALAIRKKVHGEEHPSVAQTIAALGYVAQQDLDHTTGARLHADALAMRRRLLGNEHPAVAASLDALGYSYVHEFNWKKEAEEAYAESFAIRRKMLGDQHPQTVVSLLRFAGQLNSRHADPAALAILREFVSNQRKLLPPKSPLLAPPLLALASVSQTAATNESVQELVREAHPLLESSGGPAPLEPQIIEAMDFFAWSKFGANLPAEGREMSEAAFKLARAAFGEKRGALFPTRTLGWIYFRLGLHELAVQQFEAAVRLERSHLGPWYFLTLGETAALASCYSATNRIADALTLLEAAMDEYDRAHVNKVGTSDIVIVMNELGYTYIASSRFDEAAAMFRRALSNYDRNEIPLLGLRHHPRQRAVSGLGRALAGQGKFAEAEPLVLEAFHELETNVLELAGDRKKTVCDAAEAVIATYEAWGKPALVAEWKTKLAELRARQL